MKSGTIGCICIALLATYCIGPLAFAENRTWVDSTGKFRIEAEFAGLSDGNVRLRKSDGSVVQVPVAKLSSDDRLWVMRNRKNVSTDVPASSGNAALTSVGSWPRWRGPGNDGISKETGLLTEWSDAGPPLAWSSRGLGAGFSSVAIAGGKLFTLGKKGGSTKLICVSAQDGAPLWDVDMNDRKDPNGTPTVDLESNLVYGISFNGILICADIETGREVWRKDFRSDFNGRMESMWGYSESPLVDGENLICTPGSDQGVVVALNKRTGNVVWRAPMRGGEAGYSSVVISHGGGVKQYVTLVKGGLIGVRASDGALLWNYPNIANGTANVPTPIVKGDFVFGSSGYNDGGSALIRLMPAGRDRVRAQEVYYRSNKDVQNHHGGMVLIGDHIYMGHGHNNGFPMCLDLRTGQPTWGRQRGPGKGSAAVVAADGHLYFRYEDAVMALIEVNPSSYRLKGTFNIKTKHKQSWSHPVIVDKKLYLRDQDELHCYDIAG